VRHRLSPCRRRAQNLNVTSLLGSRKKNPLFGRKAADATLPCQECRSQRGEENWHIIGQFSKSVDPMLKRRRKVVRPCPGVVDQCAYWQSSSQDANLGEKTCQGDIQKLAGGGGGGSCNCPNKSRTSYLEGVMGPSFDREAGPPTIPVRCSHWSVARDKARQYVRHGGGEAWVEG